MLNLLCLNLVKAVCLVQCKKKSTTEPRDALMLLPVLCWAVGECKYMLTLLTGLGKCG